MIIEGLILISIGVVTLAARPLAAMIDHFLIG